MAPTDLYSLFLACGQVSTDTRSVVAGSLFFALRGDRFDGNRFAGEALEKGARWAVIDNPDFEVAGRTILVSDTLDALQALARTHRARLKIPVIGLTGSNGKTTSKELLRAVLQKKFRTFATPGNLNNHIGVPLSLLAVDQSMEMAVIEMGANHVGEIARLSDIAQPTHGFITNIGKAHIGTFGGFENIVRGKSEMFQYLREHGGVVFVNSQNPLLANMAKRFKNPVFYPAAGDFLHAELVEADPWVKVKTETGEIIATQLAGAYNFENIAVALCVGKYFGVPAAAAHEAIAAYRPANMRSQIIGRGSNQIILDAYNANPNSMAAAIESLHALHAPRKVLVLGDMFELEAEADREHRAVLELIGAKAFQDVFLCGNLFWRVRDALPSGHFFETRDAMARHLAQHPPQNATILIKGSRGMGLEKILDVMPGGGGGGLRLEVRIQKLEGSGQ
jgi:UDP-N-acetylmuramoyl-tripeptide--D-alanyl-D-alanine ligase